MPDSRLTENTLAAITDKKADSRSLGASWADTGTSAALDARGAGQATDVQRDLCGQGRLSRFWRGLYGAVGVFGLRPVSLCRRTLIVLYCAG